ncbi:YafY family protein [Roseobacter sp. HKCCA0434]|uniref:helix-turn-helix transcriptional regulator n=1 Tax=Roseobacter sp. HKCCA0434 TaxID=3079297 RepID=UPI002905996C|nr:YafY family protein [Roseobacter sp. HKCCA0434]
MRRADRLFRIVQHLRAGRLVTARDLAERMEVSERTIYRDIADLMGSGVPVEGEAGLGYLMRDGYDLPPLMFTRDELHALVAGIRMVRAFGGSGLAASAETALSKIATVLPETRSAELGAVPIQAASVGPLATRARDMLDRLQAACDGCILLSLTYRDAQERETERTVRPLGLMFWGRVWTLVGWCELRDDFRMFRVDRIAGAVEGPRFTPSAETSLVRFYELHAPNGERPDEGLTCAPS